MLRLLVVGYLFLAALYATAIPPGKGPDETAHLRYVSYLAQHHRLPVFQRENPGSDYEFHQPPLYYLICLPTYLLTSSSPEAAAQAVRFVTILLGLPLLYLTFALGRTLAPERPAAAVAAAAVVAFLPMHLALVSSANNDVLTEVFFAAALVLMVRHLRAGSAYRQQQAPPPPLFTMALAGIMTGLGLLTKSLAVLLLPMIWATAVLAARGPQGYEWRRLARDLAVSTGLALALAGWWLWRNQVLYGDPLAQKVFLSAFRDRPSPQEFMQRTGLQTPSYVVLVITWTLASGLGMFGPVYGNRFVFFPYWVYLVFGAKALSEAGGFVRHLRRTPQADWQRQSWWLSALLVGLLLVSFIRFNFSFFQAQARYLFPGLPAAALALCLGLGELAPARREEALLVGLFLLLLLAVAGLFIWIIPQFQLAPPVP